MMPDRELCPLGDHVFAYAAVRMDRSLGDISSNAFKHFSRRVRERMGAGVSPGVIWVELRYAVRYCAPGLAFCLGRLPDHRRAWQFRGPCGRFFVAIYDHTGDVPVTVMTAAQFADTPSTRRGLLAKRLLT